MTQDSWWESNIKITDVSVERDQNKISSNRTNITTVEKISLELPKAGLPLLGKDIVTANIKT